MNILIVEDSLSLITLYVDIIKKLRSGKPTNITTVMNCNDYEKYYSKTKFDLALIVWQLQNCNSLSIIKDIVSKTQLYIISGKSNVEYVTTIASQFGVPVKVKPITVVDIQDMLYEVEQIKTKLKRA